MDEIDFYFSFLRRQPSRRRAPCTIPYDTRMAEAPSQRTTRMTPIHLIAGIFKGCLFPGLRGIPEANI